MVKKITIITSYFAPAWAYGGPPKVLFTLAKSLVKTGISIDVITTDSIGENRSVKLYEVLEEIRIYRFRNLSNTLAYKSNFFYVPGVTSKVQKILSNTDVVLFSDVRSIFNWQLYRLVKDKNIPYGVFAFGEILHGNGIKSIVKKIFDLVWVRDYIRNAKWLFAQTEHEVEMYNSFFGISKSDINLLPLPIEKAEADFNKLQIAQFKKKINIAAADKVITYVGRINYLKGIDILVRSVESLLRSDKKVKLLIIGRDDGYLSSLLSLIPKDIKKQVIFTGPLYNKDIEAAFAISSCFAITPRFYEETSTAALQALSYGVPVVVTKEAEVPYLSSYHAGFLTENDPENIRAAIQKIIYSSTRKREKMSMNARKCIKDHFLSEKVTKQLLGILSE